MNDSADSRRTRITVGAVVLLLLTTAMWVTRYETLAVRGDASFGVVVERNRYTGALRMIHWEGEEDVYVFPRKPVEAPEPPRR